MPDFDTQTPPEQRPKPLKHRSLLVANRLRGLVIASKPRIVSIANSLRALLIASKPRMLLLANRLRSLLMANRRRTVVISGGILLFVVAVVALGLPIYSSSGLGDQLLEAMIEEPDGKKIALGIRRPGESYQYDFKYDLYVMNADGSSLTQLADGVDPAWSPDGKKIAFVRYVEEANSSSASAPSSATATPFTEVPYVFVMNADGSDQKKLLDISAVQPTWSPNGKEIAFSIYNQGSNTYKAHGFRYCGIYVMNADGSGEPRKLATSSGCAFSPAWSPDGKTIAFANYRGDDDYGGADIDIYAVNASGKQDNTNQPRPLTDYAPGGASDPSWSPDGTEIAFTHTDQSGRTTIFKMDAEGSGETPLTHNQHMKKLEAAINDDEMLDSQTYPTWSPDGNQIAYVGIVPVCEPGLPCTSVEDYVLSPSEINTMNSDGSNPTLARTFGKHSQLWGLDWQPLP